MLKREMWKSTTDLSLLEVRTFWRNWEGEEQKIISREKEKDTQWTEESRLK